MYEKTGGRYQGWADSGGKGVKLGVNQAHIIFSRIMPPKEICCKDGCMKRLSLTAISCKCRNKFCSEHRHPEDHHCSFDFLKNTQDELLKNMSTSVVAKKVEAI
jgi:hypothetical protein